MLEVESHLAILGRPSTIHIEQRRVAVVLEGKSVAQGAAVVEQLEVDDRASQQFHVRILPVAKIPRSLEELEPLVDRHEPPLEPVDGIADLIAIDRAGERIEYSLQGFLQRRRIFNGASILKNDGKDAMVRKVSNEFHVFLQVVDIGQRDAHRNAAQAQRPDDCGDLGTGKCLLVLERAFQVDADPYAVFVGMRQKGLLAEDRPEKRPEQKDDCKDFLRHASNTAPPKLSLDALVDGRRLVGVAVPSED